MRALACCTPVQVHKTRAAWHSQVDALSDLSRLVGVAGSISNDVRNQERCDGSGQQRRRGEAEARNVPSHDRKRNRSPCAWQSE
jgi:hypothetical protein